MVFCQSRLSRCSPSALSCNDRIVGYGESLGEATSFKNRPLDSVCVCRSQRLHPHEVRRASSHRGDCGAEARGGVFASQAENFRTQEHHQRRSHMPMCWRASTCNFDVPHGLNLSRPSNLLSYNARAETRRGVVDAKINGSEVAHTAGRIHGL